LKKQYRVIKLEQVSEYVELYLQEVYEEKVKPPEAQIPLPIPIPVPVEEPKTDEEKLVKKTFDAVKKFMPGFFTPTESARVRFPPISRPIFDVHLVLTVVDYERMGRPALLDILTLSFKRVKVRGAGKP